MQVFRCALKVAFRNPLFFLVYTVALSFMGVAMGLGASGEYGDSYEAVQGINIDYVLIDHDTGAETLGLESFLEGCGTRKEVPDSSIALQECVANGAADYILVVPDGWSEQFVQAAQEGTELPKLECVYSFYSAEGALLDSKLSNYLGLLSASIAADPGATAAQWAEKAHGMADSKAEVSTMSVGDTNTSLGLTFYFQFSIYSIFTAVVVCVCMLLTKLNRTDVRRRNLTSPVSYGSYNLQVILASLVLTLAVDAWVLGLGLACFSESAFSFGVVRILEIAGTVVIFSLVPLGLGILLGQLGISVVAANGAGNIAGLVLSFLGGAWMPLSIVPEAVRTAAQLLPGIWYTEALASSNFGFIAECWAILLLFACALFVVALAVGRLRTQTAEAGGNASAEVVLQ